MNNLETYSKPEYDKLLSIVQASSSLDDKEYLSKYLPCVLLSEENSCIAYAQRPLICRMYGCSIGYNFCDKIKNKCSGIFTGKLVPKKLRKHLVDWKPPNDLWMDIDYFNVKGTIKIERPYPMFYWFANDKLYSDLYNMAITQSRNVFINNI